MKHLTNFFCATIVAAAAGAGCSAASPGDNDDSGPNTTDYEAPGSPDQCGSSLVGEPILRRLTRLELSNTLWGVFPTAGAAATHPLPADLIQDIRLSNDASSLVMGTQMTETLMKDAEQIADAVTDPAELPNRLACAADANAACATTFIDQFGSALFRRPLTDADRARYLALFETVSVESDFNTGLKWVLVALINSTHTVHRSELGDSSGKLTPYEIASQLSYSYSAAPPSPELVALALDGTLDDPDARVAEARKLLESPGGRSVVYQFFDEWLSISSAEAVTRAGAPDNFPTIRNKMVREASRFIEVLLYDKGAKLSDLMTANFTVVDADLGAYYGFDGASGDLLTDGGVEVTRPWGVGVFAQGAVLTTMASVEITSPTRRGLLLMERLFCEQAGLPEGVNFDLESGELSGNTTRERLENAHLVGNCAGCHSAFDPLGYAFEHFDHLGRYRAQETNARGTFDIDDSATIAQLGDATVEGQEALMTELASSAAVASCVSGTMERYIYGGAGDCRAKDSRTDVMGGETTVVEFLAALAGEPHFVQRSR